MTFTKKSKPKAAALQETSKIPLNVQISQQKKVTKIFLVGPYLFKLKKCQHISLSLQFL